MNGLNPATTRSTPSLSEAAYSSADRPPRSLLQMELIVRWCAATSAFEHLEKSLPLGYHLRTMRLAFSTDPFSHEA